MPKSPRTPPWPADYLRRFRPGSSLRFAALTWGTRGDVQPFVALGSELVKRGHRVTIAAREPFRSLIEAHGLGFFRMEEDGTEELMRVLAESRGGADGAKHFVTWQRAILRPQFRQLWEATEDADAILSNAAFTVPAIHIAEERGVPIVQAFFDPGFIPTRRYGVFNNRVEDRGALRNLASVRLRNIVGGLVTRDIVRAWRKERGRKTPLLNEFNAPGLLRRLPVIAAWSEALIERPDDWPEWFVQTGRWRLPVKERVSQRLIDFMAAGPPPVYIGFGSWGSADKAAVTDVLLEALRITGDRAVLHQNTVDDRRVFPPHVFVDDDLPHDWLLPRMKVVVHHGGAGTTGAALEAGVPAVIIPAFFAQIPWGEIIAQKGVGALLMRRDLRAEALAGAIEKVGARSVRDRAAKLGARARAEGGVTLAADAIERRLNEAREAAGSPS
jgi:UDP:flavonoid glycosyltransferase YjiC (YdhE family)